MKKLLILIAILMMAVVSWAYMIPLTIDLTIDFEQEPDDIEVLVECCDVSFTTNQSRVVFDIEVDDSYEFIPVHVTKPNYNAGGAGIQQCQIIPNTIAFTSCTLRRMVDFTGTVTDENGNTPYPCVIEFWVGDLWMGFSLADEDGNFWYPLEQQLPEFGIYTYTVETIDYFWISGVLDIDFKEDIHFDFKLGTEDYGIIHGDVALHICEDGHAVDLISLAEIYIDGELMATTGHDGHYSIELDIGKHTIACVVEGFEVRKEEFEILGGQYTVIRFAMEEYAVSADDKITPIMKLDNYPNPFNPQTTISFNIAQGKTGTLEIFNVKGQRIISKEFNHGQHDFVWNADDQASGVYFYRLKSDKQTYTKKMMLLK